MATTTTFIDHQHTVVSTNVSNLAAYNQTAGHCICVIFSFYDAASGTTPATISDTAGNTYIKACGPIGDSSGPGNNFYGYVYYAKNCLGNAANVIQITYPSASNIGYNTAYAWDIAGVDPNGPLDEVAFHTQTGGVPSSDYITTSQPDAALIFYAGSTNGFSTYTAPLIGGVSATNDGVDGYTANTAIGAHLDVTGGRLPSIFATASSGTTPNLNFLVSFVPAPTPSGNLVQQKWQELVAVPASSQVIPVTLTTGNFVAVVAMPGNSGHATVTSMTDDLGNTYHLATGSNGFSGSVFSGSAIEIWYAENVTGGAGFITAVYTPGSGYGFNFMQVAEYTGVLSSSSFDTATNTSGFSATPGVSITLATANELVIGVCLTQTGNPTWSGLTDRAVGVAAGAGMLYGDAEPGTSGSFSVGGTVTGTPSFIISAAAFKLVTTIFGTPQFASGEAITTGTVSASAVNTATGDFIVVGVRADTATSYAVSDTALNTYVPLTQYLSAYGARLQWFYVLSATANASNVITVTASGGTPGVFDVAVWDFPITGGTVAFDVDTAIQDTPSASSASSAAFTTTGTDEIIFGLIGTGSVNGTVFSGGTGAQGTTYSTSSPSGSPGIGSLKRGAACSGPATTPLVAETVVFGISPSTNVGIIAAAFKKFVAPPPPPSGGFICFVVTA